MDDDDFDFDEFDSTDNLENGDGTDLKQDDRSPISNTAANIKTSFLDSLTGSGATTADKINNNISEAINIATPAILGDKNGSNVLDAFSETVSMVDDAKETIAKGSTPLLKSFKSLVPKGGLLDKLTGKVADFIGADLDPNRGYNGPSEDKVIADSVSSTMGDFAVDINATQTKLTSLTAAITDTNMKKVQETIVAGNVIALQSTSLSNKYHRESLRLKFKQLYELKNVGRQQVEIAKDMMKKFDAVIHNTALPDGLKLKTTEALSYQMKLSAGESLYSNLFKDNDWLDDFKRNTSNKIKGVTEAVINGVSMGEAGVDGYEQMASMSGDYDEEELAALDPETRAAMSAEGMAAGMAADRTRGGLISLAATKFANTKMGKRVKGVSDKIFSNPYDTLKQQANNTESGALSKILNTMASFVKPESVNVDTKLNNTKKNLTGLAVFDNRTHNTINKVLPGLLSKQLQQLEIMNGNVSAKEQTYSHVDSKFMTGDQVKDSLEEGLKNQYVSKNVNYTFREMSKRLESQSGVELTKEERRTFVEALAKHDGAISYDLLDTQIDKEDGLFSDLKDEEKLKFASLIKNAGNSEYYGKDENDNDVLKSDTDRRYDTNELLKTVNLSKENAKKKIESLIADGFIEPLIEMGMVKYDKRTDTYNIDYTRYQKFNIDALMSAYDEKDLIVTDADRERVDAAMEVNELKKAAFEKVDKLKEGAQEFIKEKKIDQFFKEKFTVSRTALEKLVSSANSSLSKYESYNIALGYLEKKHKDAKEEYAKLQGELNATSDKDSRTVIKEKLAILAKATATIVKEKTHYEELKDKVENVKRDVADGDIYDLEKFIIKKSDNVYKSSAKFAKDKELDLLLKDVISLGNGAKTKGDKLYKSIKGNIEDSKAYTAMESFYDDNIKTLTTEEDKLNALIKKLPAGKRAKYKAKLKEIRKKTKDLRTKKDSILKTFNLEDIKKTADDAVETVKDAKYSDVKSGLKSSHTTATKKVSSVWNYITGKKEEILTADDIVLPEENDKEQSSTIDEELNNARPKSNYQERKDKKKKPLYQERKDKKKSSFDKRKDKRENNDTKVNIETDNENINVTVDTNNKGILDKLSEMAGYLKPKSKIRGDKDGDGDRDNSWKDRFQNLNPFSKKDKGKAPKDIERDKKSGSWLTKLLAGSLMTIPAILKGLWDTTTSSFGILGTIGGWIAKIGKFLTPKGLLTGLAKAFKTTGLFIVKKLGTSIATSFGLLASIFGGALSMLGFKSAGKLFGRAGSKVGTAAGKKSLIRRAIKTLGKHKGKLAVGALLAYALTGSDAEAGEMSPEKLKELTDNIDTNSDDIENNDSETNDTNSVNSETDNGADDGYGLTDAATDVGMMVAGDYVIGKGIDKVSALNHRRKAKKRLAAIKKASAGVKADIEETVADEAEIKEEKKKPESRDNEDKNAKDEKKKSRAEQNKDKKKSSFEKRKEIKEANAEVKKINAAETRKAKAKYSSSVNKVKSKEKGMMSWIASKVAKTKFGKKAVKFVAKNGLKKIPLLGQALSLGTIATEVASGQFKKASLSTLSAIAALIPIVGTAASFGVDAYHDSDDDSDTKDKSKNDVKDGSDISGVDKNGIVKSLDLSMPGEKKTTPTKIDNVEYLAKDKIAKVDNVVLQKRLTKEELKSMGAVGIAKDKAIARRNEEKMKIVRANAAMTAKKFADKRVIKDKEVADKVKADKEKTFTLDPEMQKVIDNVPVDKPKKNDIVESVDNKTTTPSIQSNAANAADDKIKETGVGSTTDINLNKKFDKMVVAKATRANPGVVTKGDKILLEAISIHESAAGAKGYDMINNGKLLGSSKYVPTKMTLLEIAQMQALLKKKHKSGATGKYQFVPATLKETLALTSIKPDDLFDIGVQDKLILKRLTKVRKYNAWRSGLISDRHFIYELSKEFASIENPGTGKTYYVKTKNIARNMYADMKLVLKKVREADNTKDSGIKDEDELKAATDKALKDRESSGDSGSSSSGLMMGLKAAIKAALAFFGMENKNSAEYFEKIESGGDAEESKPGSKDTEKASGGGVKVDLPEKASTAEALCGLTIKKVPEFKKAVDKAGNLIFNGGPKYLVIHNTAGSNLYLGRMKKDGYGTQLWIDKDGTIILVGDINSVVYHVGKRKPAYNQISSVVSLGIEMVCAWNKKTGWDPYTEKQKDSLRKLGACVMNTFHISKENVVWHDLISYKTKDEGKEGVMILRGMQLPDASATPTAGTAAPIKSETSSSGGVNIATPVTSKDVRPSKKQSEQGDAEGKTVDKPVKDETAAQDTDKTNSGYSKSQVSALKRYVKSSEQMTETTSQKSKTYKEYDKAYDALIKEFPNNPDVSTDAKEILKKIGEDSIKKKPKVKEKVKTANVPKAKPKLFEKQLTTKEIKSMGNAGVAKDDAITKRNADKRAKIDAEVQEIYKEYEVTIDDSKTGNGHVTLGVLEKRLTKAELKEAGKEGLDRDKAIAEHNDRMRKEVRSKVAAIYKKYQIVPDEPKIKDEPKVKGVVLEKRLTKAELKKTGNEGVVKDKAIATRNEAKVKSMKEVDKVNISEVPKKILGSGADKMINDISEVPKKLIASITEIPKQLISSITDVIVPATPAVKPTIPKAPVVVKTKQMPKQIVSDKVLVNEQRQIAKSNSESTAMYSKSTAELTNSMSALTGLAKDRNATLVSIDNTLKQVLKNQNITGPIKDTKDVPEKKKISIPVDTPPINLTKNM